MCCITKTMFSNRLVYSFKRGAFMSISTISIIGIVIAAMTLITASVALIISSIDTNKSELIYRGDCGVNLTVPELKELKGKNIKVSSVDDKRFLSNNTKERVFHVVKNGIYNGKIFNMIKLRMSNKNGEYRYDITVEEDVLVMTLRLKDRYNLIKPMSNRYLGKAVILSLLNFDNVKFKYLKKMNCIVVYKPYFPEDDIRG